MKIEYILAIVFAVVVAILLIISLLYWLLKSSRRLKEQAGGQEIFKSIGSGRIPIVPENKNVVNALFKVNASLAEHVSCQFSVMQILLDAIKYMMLENGEEEALILKLNEICIDIFSAYYVIDFRSRVSTIRINEYNLLANDLVRSYQDMCDICEDLLSLIEQHKVTDYKQCCAQLMKNIVLECKNECLMLMLQEQSYNCSVLPSIGLEDSFVNGVGSCQQDMC
ncbi:hypothetical protein [Ehrlichia canis]|uniref:Uncharacterized protein n=1 Tax=Ehrlichia canis (strain Jake) TaxID=269484 RepID=A0ACA6AW81_EHRCJ|nr:hypothetical protein [Ehrlichia canis]AAZ68753.1 hypothetical protein Ecaj_0721 [Ehrlichia canis str. Jake]AUO54518.1 hypothetical protein C1I72_01185 [Ehrlichia canis]UKC53519.1 hypothetical protein s20019040002_000562 [Ehrlichia canis]UKC54457.1 hypothetical protein s20026770001_000563 [Ehrlichia canis]UKC55393.1 hypothetical protein s21009500007_000563 [Ehrlichia canis]